MKNKEKQIIGSWKQEDFKENGVGTYLKENREMRGYSQLEVCDGICSESTLSRIEAGEEAVDFQIIEAFISRMGIEKSEYEFFLVGSSAAKLYKYGFFSDTFIGSFQAQRSGITTDGWTNIVEGKYLFRLVKANDQCTLTGQMKVTQ